jgi:hypothetical protein
LFRARDEHAVDPDPGEVIHPWRVMLHRTGIMVGTTMVLWLMQLPAWIVIVAGASAMLLMNAF